MFFQMDAQNVNTLCRVTARFQADSPEQAVRAAQSYGLRVDWPSVRRCDEREEDLTPWALVSWWEWVSESKWSDPVCSVLMVGSAALMATLLFWDDLGLPRAHAQAAAGRPAIAHVAMGAGGNLDLEAGYEWAGGPTLRAAWVKGKRYPASPHVASSAYEGTWDADPGYTLVPGDGPRVRWIPGLPLPGHPHVVAGAGEGQWSPEQGYEFVPAACLAVQRKPGSPDLSHPTVLTVGEPGTSHLAASYTPSAARKPANPGVHRHGPTQDQVAQAIIDVVFAAGANGLSRPQADDGMVAAAGRSLAREVRNAAFNDALHNLFPDRPPALLDAGARVLTLAMDRKLTVGNWASATARDAIVGELRRYDPADADVLDIAGFIAQAMAAYHGH